MFYPRVLVVTSCTGEKRFKPQNQLRIDDFRNPDSWHSRWSSLSEYAYTAGRMYTGAQHLRTVEGVNILRQVYGTEMIDLIIISAGYGLIREYENILPYEVTFNTMKGEELDQWALMLNIHADFETTIQNYDLIFVLLGENYLRTLSLPVKTHQGQTIIFLASHNSLKYLKCSGAKSYALLLSNREAKYYGYGLVGLKGFILKKFAGATVKDRLILSQVYKSPELFTSIIDTEGIQLNLPLDTVSSREKLDISVPFYNTQISSASDERDTYPNDSNLPKIINLKEQNGHKLKLGRSETDEIIPIPNIKRAINYGLGLKYFIPEWDDYVDPEYNFINDLLAPGRKPHDDEVYAHQIYSPPAYDGVLVSRTVFDKSKRKSDRILEEGIHKYVRFNGKIMGDCGAFGYIAEEEPPYKTTDILDYYQKIGFDYGVSIDHLIVGGFAQPGIREKRYDLTRKNAIEFIEKHMEGGYSFTPIGAVQGWNPESYASAVKDYIGMGYKYIGLGGLARTPTPEILIILQAINPHLTPDTRIHLFGVGRLNAVPIFRHLGVNSFDSASPLRKAWLDPAANYHGVNGKIYAAVRIPKTDGSRIKNIVKAGVASIDTLQRLEEQALSSLRKFDSGNLSLDETLDALLAYDKLLELPRDGAVDPAQAARRLKKHARMYKVLLEDKPWQDCNCKICSDIRVEVVIFRGNDRNRRRGFHNTYIFYKRFQEMLNDNNTEEQKKTLVESDQMPMNSYE